LIEVLRAGTSVIDISPSKGIELAGYPHFLRHNTGIHDPLYASCILLDDEKIKIVLVCMDILFFSKKYVNEIRRRVSEKIDILPANIMISCSHTHSGPWASGRLDLEALEKDLKPDYGFIEDLKEKIVHIICKASENLFQAKIGVDFGICGKECAVGGNRRIPGGPSDPEVWVVGVKDLKDNFKAALVKYSLHPTVIHEDSTLVSADYSAYIRNYLSETKPGMIMLFAQGTSGDQSTRYFRKNQSFDEAERIGNEIGKVSNHVLDSLQFSQKLQLFSESKEIDIDLRVLPSEAEAIRNVKITSKKLEKLKNKNAPYMKIQNANLSNLGAECTLGYTKLKSKGISIELEVEELPVEVQVIGIGDTRIVGLQGEIFLEFGLEIQKRSPAKKTFVIELANGALPGYVCTERAIAEGGYEAETTLINGKAGKKLVDTALCLLDKININKN
jgi:neutral ceramidase